MRAAAELLLAAVAAPAGGIPLAATRNVLLIIVDDLRPEMTPGYGQTAAITPNLDRLAGESVLFKRAYCQQAICGPTRNSFLSGRRPQRTLAWNFVDSFREVGPDWVSLPQYFKEAGYLTLGAGKTYHPGIPPNHDEPKSWSQERPYYTDPLPYVPCWRWPGGVKNPLGSLACPTAQAEESFPDYKAMRATVDNLRYAHNQSVAAGAAGRARPFFLALGIHRPHIPWTVPQRFWDMYPENDQIALPAHQEAPSGMPPIAFTYEMDGETVLQFENERVPVPYPHHGTPPDNITRGLRKGYYAAVSFTDFVVGEMLRELSDLGHDNDTIVALIGDHGYQLGEHNIWAKHSNFELAARVPLLFRAPGLAAAESDALVESVDLYPTLAALAGLPPPPDVDGADLTPLFAAPAPARRRGAGPDAAYTEYPRCPPNVSEPWGDTTSCVHTAREDFTAMGYSVRVDQWRYTEWRWWDGARLQGDFARAPIGTELYAHAGDGGTDYDAWENANVVGRAENADVVARLRALAAAHWDRAARGEPRPVASPRPPPTAPRGLQFEHV